VSHTVECIACGHVGSTGKKGSTLVTIALLIIIFPAGILYWLLNRGGGVCSACKSSNVRLYNLIKNNQSAQIQRPESNVQQIQCSDCREYIRYDARKCKHCGGMVNT